MKPENAELGTKARSGMHLASSRLYKFDLVLAPGSDRSVTIHAAAYLSAGFRIANVGGGTWLTNITSPTTGSASATATFHFIFPSPGVGAMAGLGLMVAARRRR